MRNKNTKKSFVRQSDDEETLIFGVKLSEGRDQYLVMENKKILSVHYKRKSAISRMKELQSFHDTFDIVRGS